MTTTKRFAILLLTVVLFGTAACADTSGPQAETCTEAQGTGGRTCNP